MSLVNAFLFVIVLSSCAQQRVTLKDQRLAPYEGFRDVTYLPFATLPVKLEAVSDNRKVQSAVGEARTGAQFKKTPVNFEDSFLEVFKDYLRNELKKRNVLMVMEDHQVVMSVSVKELWVEEVLEKYQPEKARCHIKIEVFASKDKNEYSGTFWTEMVSPGDLGDATEKLGPTLASCMNLAVEKIVNDKKFVEFVKAPPMMD